MRTRCANHLLPWQAPHVWYGTRQNLTCSRVCHSTCRVPFVLPHVLVNTQIANASQYPLIARFMGPTWGPSGADRTHVGPMLAPLTLLSGSSIQLTNTEYDYQHVKFKARFGIFESRCQLLCVFWFAKNVYWLLSRQKILLLNIVEFF